MAKYLIGHASSDLSGGIDTTLDVFKRSDSGLVYEAVAPVGGDGLQLDDSSSNGSHIGGSFMFSGVRLDRGDFGSSGSIPLDPLAAIILEKARISLANCESYSRRLDLYAEAAERGSAEALYLWGMMIKYGTESANTQCGSSNTDGTGRSSVVGSASSVIKGLFQGTKQDFSYGARTESERSTYAFLVAADMGHAAAIVPLAFALLHGTGAEVLMRNPLARLPVSLNIPLHPSYITAASVGFETFYRLNKLHFMMSKALLQRRKQSNHGKRSMSETRKNKQFSLASSVIDGDSYLPVSDHPSEEGCNKDYDTIHGSCAAEEETSPSIDATALAIGMLHVAALHSVPEAHKALAYR